MSDEPDVDAFVRQHWAAIAGFAWKSHSRGGRGAVTVRWTTIAEPGAAPELGWSGRIPGHAIAQAAIDSYDPQTAVVVVVASADALLLIQAVSETIATAEKYRIPLEQMGKVGPSFVLPHPLVVKTYAMTPPPPAIGDR